MSKIGRKPKKRKPHILARPREARELITRIQEYRAWVSVKEFLFVLKIGSKLEKRDFVYLSGKQMRWLRDIEGRIYSKD